MTALPSVVLVTLLSALFVSEPPALVGSFEDLAGRAQAAREAGWTGEAIAALGLGMSTFRQSSFGARFLDYDNDGDPDLFIAAGHPFEPVARVWPEVHYADPPLLFENEGGRFTNVAAERGEALRVPHVGRGTRSARASRSLPKVGRARACAPAVEATSPLRIPGCCSAWATPSAWDSLEVRWPSGLVERFPAPPIDRYTSLREGSGTPRR